MKAFVHWWLTASWSEICAYWCFATVAFVWLWGVIANRWEHRQSIILPAPSKDVQRNQTQAVP